MLWMVCRVSEEALRLNQAAGRFVTIAGDGVIISVASRLAFLASPDFVRLLFVRQP